MRPSIATRGNLDLIEENYRRWEKNPESVDGSWRAFFEGFELGNTPQRNGASAVAAPAVAGARESPLQTRIDGLVYAYRTLGHTVARINPLADKRPENPLLSLRELGFSEKDLDLQVSSKFFLDNKKMTLREMIARLEEIYADAIGTEFQHIQNPRIRNWVRDRLESRPAKHQASIQVEIALLRLLLESEAFEVFLHTRYVGQKRFSLQGAESLMVILDTILHRCPGDGIEEICMGMAHRGRLNVLANFLKKSLEVIFTEFSTNYVPELVAGDGDVKYHLGYRTIRKLASGAQVEIRLAANPSHLEAVDPVVEGIARARQRIRGDIEHRRKVLPLLIHGDAAFAGQGIVAETLNMSQLHGYSTGGTVHVVVNNQIGFTTLPEDARSSMYATDIAKMIEAPIFHVNGDDPIAVRFVAETALDFRQTFGRDAVIDMYCYRRYGHNEGDEPLFTQPDLYVKIAKRPSVAQLYKQELLESGVLNADDAASLEAEFELRLEMTLEEVKSLEQEEPGQRNRFHESTAVFQPKYSSESAPTAISPETLKQIVAGLTRVPEGFNLLPKVKRITIDRQREVYRSRRTLRLGICRGACFRVAPAWRACRCVCRGRIAGAAHSAIGTRFFTMRRRASRICLCSISRPIRRASAFTTAFSPKPRSSVSTTAIRSITRACFAFGKRSSAILRTARRPSSISSSFLRNRNGSGRAESCCSCRMATKARDRSTPAHGSSASSRPVRRITSRSAT